MSPLPNSSRSHDPQPYVLRGGAEVPVFGGEGAEVRQVVPHDGPEVRLPLPAQQLLRPEALPVPPAAEPPGAL